MQHVVAAAAVEEVLTTAMLRSYQLHLFPCPVVVELWWLVFLIWSFYHFAGENCMRCKQALKNNLEGADIVLLSHSVTTNWKTVEEVTQGFDIPQYLTYMYNRCIEGGIKC